MTERLAPCGWEATPCESCCASALDSIGQDLADVLADQAVYFLWQATGQQYGLCETVLRPCRQGCGSFWGGLPFPIRIEGEWLNLTCMNRCGGGCSCTYVSEFSADDVDSVVSVMLEGGEQSAIDTCQVLDRRRIVRIDGDRWPLCQNLGASDDEAGTWSVTVMQGKPIPPGGEIMAGIFLCELAKACTGDESCRLPKNVQTMTRQGISVDFTNRWASLAMMKTGLYEVDAWIESARTTVASGASLLSPDRPEPAVVTWPLSVGSS